jgi:hypothetical protein
VSLSWTAPLSNGGSSITDYVVQFKRESDSGWSTFTDGVSTNNSAIVSGLAYETRYTFRVAASNSVGVGGYSTPTAAAVLNVVLPNLPAGSKYQIAFVTAGTIGGQSKNIADYNAFVANEASAGWQLAPG